MKQFLAENIPTSIEVHITEKLINQYAVASSDDNPIHISNRAAVEAGFPKKVAHGMLTMAISSRFVSPLLGKRWRLESVETKFSHPVYVNDRIRISRSISSFKEDKCVITFSGKNQLDKRVIHGKLVIISREFTSS